MAEDFNAIPTHVTTVRRAELRTPNVRRLTLGGGLERLHSVGPDSFLYFLLPPPGSDTLTVDTSFSWERYYEMPADERPVGAYYTIRHHRPELGEIDVDMVLHGDHGAASRWARRAEVGDAVALWGPRTTFHPPLDAEHFLLIADDTGLPATCVIAESLTADQIASIVVEVDDVGEQQPITSKAHIDVTWLHRDGAEPGTTTALFDAVCPMDPIRRPAYVWGGGESHAMTAVRKHVRHVWGLPRERVSLTPYWRHPSSPIPDAEDESE